MVDHNSQGSNFRIAYLYFRKHNFEDAKRMWVGSREGVTETRKFSKFWPTEGATLQQMTLRDSDFIPIYNS